MRILVSILLLFVFCKSFSQTTFPITQSIGGKTTNVRTEGTLGSLTGFTFMKDFLDTTEANSILYVQYTPGILIRVADTLLYLRNQTVNKWVLIGSSGGGGGGTVTGANNGLSLSGTTAQWGGRLIQTTNVSFANQSMTFDSVGTWAINNRNGTTTWTWNALGANTGLVLQNSGTASGNTNTVMKITQSGATAINQTTYGLDIQSTRTGTGGSNVSLRLNSVGKSGTGNGYALIVDTGFVGIGENQPGSRLWIRTNNMHETFSPSSGLVFSNDSIATAAYDQASPSLIFNSAGWKTDAPAASEGVNFTVYQLPEQGTAHPTARLKFGFSVGSLPSSPTDVMAFGSAGQLYDKNGGAGTSGQVPVSAGASTGWAWGSVATPNWQTVLIAGSTLTQDNTIINSGHDLLFAGAFTFLDINDAGGDIGFVVTDDFSITSPDVLLITEPTLSNDTTNNKILTRNTSTGEVGITNWANANTNVYNSDGTQSADRVWNANSHSIQIINPTSFSIGAIGATPLITFTAGSNRYLNLQATATAFSSPDSLKIWSNDYSKKNIMVSPDSLLIRNLTSTIDTTTYKPMAVSAIGEVRRFNSWAQATGGGASGLTIGTTTITSGTTTRILYDNAGVLGEYTITGTGTVVAMQTSPSFTTPILGTPTSGTLTNTTGYLWNNLTNPTGTQTLTFDDAELNAWTISSDGETFWTKTANSITTGTVELVTLNGITTGTGQNFTSTSTAALTNSEMINIDRSGTLTNTAQIIVGARISISTTNATSGTNIALSASATNALTDNWAIDATGGVRSNVGFFPTTNDGAPLGSTALQFSDLFGASGMVINFNSGNYTVTHSASLLTFSNSITMSTGSLIAIGVFSSAANGDNANLHVIASATGGTSNNAAVQLGGSSTVGTRVKLNGNTNFTLSASNSYGGFIVGSEPITEAPSGTASLSANFAVKSYVITNGTGTMTDATTSYIEGRPTGATGAFTTTNPLTAFWVATGIARFGDTLAVGTASPNSTVHLNGSVSHAYVAKTAIYSATVSDYIIDCTANTFTVTVPTAVGIVGRVYVIKNSGAGVITVAATGGQTFDGAATLTLAANISYTIVSDNANWKVI